MVKTEILIIADYTHASPVTLVELCEICSISPDFIQALVEHDVVRPHGESIEEWLFSLEQLERVRVAKRLKRDLEINYQGIALVLDLLEELDELRAQAGLVERHYFNDE